MTPFIDPEFHELTDLVAIAGIADAANQMRIAKYLRSTDAIATAKDELRRAVLTANDLGISWQAIGDVLGVARGNAYQRFRRKSTDEDD